MNKEKVAVKITCEKGHINNFIKSENEYFGL